MAISVRAGYAIHGLGCISALGKGKPVEFRAIWDTISFFAKDNRLSEGYAAKLFRELVRAGLVESHPGVKGGYTLTREPERISFLQVVEAVDGPLKVTRCLLSQSRCVRQDRCTIYCNLLDTNAKLREQLGKFHIGMVRDEILTEVAR